MERLGKTGKRTLKSVGKDLERLGKDLEKTWKGLEKTQKRFGKTWKRQKRSRTDLEKDLEKKSWKELEKEF